MRTFNRLSSAWRNFYDLDERRFWLEMTEYSLVRFKQTQDEGFLEFAKIFGKRSSELK